MGGGLLQLAAYGSQDTYLTGNPQITFLRVYTINIHIFQWNQWSKHLVLNQVLGERFHVIFKWRFNT